VDTIDLVSQQTVKDSLSVYDIWELVGISCHWRATVTKTDSDDLHVYSSFHKKSSYAN